MSLVTAVVFLILWLNQLLNITAYGPTEAMQLWSYTVSIYAFALIALLISMDSAFRSKELKLIGVLLKVFCLAASIITLPSLLKLVLAGNFDYTLPKFWYLISTISWDLSLLWWVSAIILVSPFQFNTDLSDVTNDIKKSPEENSSHQENIKPDVVNRDLIERFERDINRHEIYSDLNTNLSSIAQFLGTSPQTLSTSINRHYNKNFRSLLNQIRIQAIINSMGSMQKKPNFIALAFDFGFSSKASFNRVFKQSTGTTPTEFYRNIQASNDRFDVERQLN